jgi:DNA alkylation damage repair protein AlkB
MSLFEGPSNVELSEEPLGPGATILRNFAMTEETEIMSGFNDVVSKARLRHMITPGGFRMSVAMTNCGALGWVTDRTGYRYDPMDPASGLQWPPMPESFLRLATNAAAKVGFKEFVPDSCLINRYDSGARLTLHQDKNERDFGQPSLRVAGTLRYLPVRRPQQDGHSTPREADAWRHSCLGRTLSAAISRRAATHAGTSSFGGGPSHQPDVAQGCVSGSGRAFVMPV